MKLKNLIPDREYQLSIYGTRNKQKSDPKSLSFRTIPLLAPPTDFTVNYTTPYGGLLTWKMEHLEHIDGFEVFIYNKDIRAQHPTGSPTPVKIIHMPNNQTHLLLTELHWDTKYRVVISAVRGKDTTDKLEISFKTDIFVEPVFTCNVKGRV